MQNLSLHWRNWTASRKYARSRVIEQPLRGELFGVEQLARHARALATSHQVVTQHTPDRLLSRLSANEQCLRAFNRSTLAINSTRRITPAADWVLDNFYLIEEQIQMARRHLPRGYSRELPRLVNATSSGLPRVYEIVLELISHVDAQVDAADQVKQATMDADATMAAAKASAEAEKKDAVQSADAVRQSGEQAAKALEEKAKKTRAGKAPVPEVGNAP
jgi:hypothetical protein